MNKEELYELALSDVPKYSLLNEIFAIRDKNIETVDYTIGVNGFISLDVLNKYINVITNWNELKEWLKSFQDYHIIQKGKCDNEFNYALVEEDINVLGDVLQKMQEIESRK